jgi:hypothetical protein
MQVLGLVSTSREGCSVRQGTPSFHEMFQLCRPDGVDHICIDVVSELGSRRQRRRNVASAVSNAKECKGPCRAQSLRALVSPATLKNFRARRMDTPVLRV